MGRFFISYRRKDMGYAGWINEILTFELGEERVFFDVEALRAGEDFARQLDEELADCDAMVVVIGPAWSEPGEDSGVRRLHRPGDYVRREVEHALRRNVPVIPVSVGDTPLPAAEDLPDGLRSLPRRQDIELSDKGFRHDVRRLLVKRLKQIPARGSRRAGESPTFVLSPMQADAATLIPETAGGFAFLWLAGTFSFKSKPGLRLAIADRPQEWIGLYDVPVGERFGLQTERFDSLPVHVLRPNVEPPRALQVFVNPLIAADPRKLTSQRSDITFLAERVKNVLLGSG